ncbi:hypothetical protein E2C01_016635 [Portunus trituberculatus]|uniref:Uncharacterized protein n=1 Tax=Portunus trituberculatus TaxID=210409 RepID=A0A5B7DR83_PORTR|nr:hypothetical protein [Portunus trituberculatus]
MSEHARAHVKRIVSLVYGRGPCPHCEEKVLSHVILTSEENFIVNDSIQIDEIRDNEGEECLVQVRHVKLPFAVELVSGDGQARSRLILGRPQLKTIRTPRHSGYRRRVTDLHCVIVSDNVGDVQCDVRGGLQHLHLHLHVAHDAEVAIDERLQPHQVVQRPQGSRKTRTPFSGLQIMFICDSFGFGTSGMRRHTVFCGCYRILLD